jgi:hypothetical protein
LADAFAKTHAATEDLSKSVQDIANEHKDLQKQYDELTMTSTQLLTKQRDALDASNRSLFDQVQAITTMKDAATALLGNVDSAFSVLQRVTQSSIDVLNTRITKEKALSDAIRSTLDSMKMPGTEAADRAAAQAQIKAALAIAKAGGPLPDATALQKSLGTVSKDASSLFATYQDYQRDFYSTQNDIASLGDLADSALSVDEKSLNALNDMLASEQKQIDLLKGIDTSALTIAEAMERLTSAMSAARQNPIVSSAGPIADAYQQYLGRAPDAAGLQWWQNEAAKGVPISSIVDGIAHSAEADLNKLYQGVLGRAPDAAGLSFWMNAYGPNMDGTEMSDFLKNAAPELQAKDGGSQNDFLKSHGVPGFAVGGDFGGGLRIVGENGPELESTGPSRITNSRDFMSRLSSPSESNAVLVAAVERLTETVEQQQAALDKIARETKRQADGMEIVTDGFNAMRTTA